MLQIDRARETLAARRAIEEAKTAKLEASKNVLQSQLELERAKLTGDDRKIKIAQLGLNIAQQELGISQQKIKDAQQALQVEKQITKLRLDANKKQSQAELLNTTNDIRLNNPNLLVPKKQRAPIPVDYKPVVDVRLPSGEKLDISGYEQYLNPQQQQASDDLPGLSDIQINRKFKDNIKPDNFKPVVDIRLPGGEKLDISGYEQYLKPQQQKDRGIDRSLLTTGRQSSAFEPLPEYQQSSLNNDLKEIFQGFSPISSQELTANNAELSRSVSRLSEIFPQLGDNTIDSNGADRRNQKLADKINQKQQENIEKKSTYVKNILDTNTQILGKVSELLESIKSQPLGQISINNEITQENQNLADEVSRKNHRFYCFNNRTSGIVTP